MTTIEAAKKIIAAVEGPDKEILTATATAYAHGLEQGYRLKEVENGQANGKSTEHDTGKSH